MLGLAFGWLIWGRGDRIRPGADWRLVNNELTLLPTDRFVSELFCAAPSTGAEVLWMSGAMAIIALGLFVTRAMREF